MSTLTEASSSPTAVQSIMSTCIYVDDFARAVEFYTRVLGLEHSIVMGETACFLRVGENENGIYLEGGYEPLVRGSESVGVSCMLVVGSATALFDRLKQAGAELVHDKPQHMGGENYWFKFYDPAGNLLEAVSTGESN